MTITGVSERIRSRNVSPVDLVQLCLERIDSLDQEIRAWVEVDRSGALSAAARMEAEIREGGWKGPLHGIPLGVKDIVHVEGFPTRAGSRIMANVPPADRDSTVVAKLREAGAVILGKTVTTEFACFDPAETRNPWDLSHTPGGSSSGSAAAVAADMCFGAIGSQTGGSISRPAAYCGIVGCKPTYGRVSTNGFIPVSISLDHPGPFARSVSDAALLLQTISGHDPEDPVSSPLQVDDYVKACHTEGDSPPRIGRSSDLFRDVMDPHVSRALEKAGRDFESGGAILTEARIPDGFCEVYPMHRTLMCAELATVHKTQFPDRKEEYRPKIRGLIEEGQGLTAAAYATAREHQLQFKKAIGNSLKEFDALLTPATPTTAPDLTTTGDPIFNSPWSYSGLPTVVIPVEIAKNGLPVAVQLVGHPFGEADLFRVARWCERVIGFEDKPAKRIS